MCLPSLGCGHFHQLLGCAELLLRCCPWGWSVFLGHPFTSPSLWRIFKTATTSGYGCCWVQASAQLSRAEYRHQKEWLPHHLSSTCRDFLDSWLAPWVKFQTIPTELMLCVHRTNITYTDKLHTSQILSLQEFCGVKSFSELQEEFLLNTEFLQQVFQGKLMGVLPL